MISSLRGTVLSALGGTVVLEVGGVGFSVLTTPAAALSVRIGDEARLLTTLVVREDSLTLFGFPTAEELSVFEVLMGVTGVGPKSALGVLAALSPDQIARAVATEDDAAFRKVSGIGPKTAKLIVLSLTGKLLVAPGAAPAPASVPASSTGESVVAALVGLGWSERVAATAVEEIMGETPDISVPVALRQALSRLGPATQSGSRA
ncbi:MULTISPECIES: Holliday junction branch migration protein RuvA [unclassified Leifsonia]|uniref:Holliday junction branch migration protein RuvA n=1 Tax=unclassified Leifsonia TaxID=2663824 RepID=UPI0006F1E218|nr:MULTISPECIES: Holliday junction branch migration protein RuvA [unclassified Leifsonia]KQX06778.1 ATP-dependent DNA helicase RuvA [Leifsonia sp. Root1293]KRA11063.1 ATP-dependent DNA helicase RuvA [Leifsonia sp. Root60]